MKRRQGSEEVIQGFLLELGSSLFTRGSGPRPREAKRTSSESLLNLLHASPVNQQSLRQHLDVMSMYKQASQRLPAALSFPPKLLGMYGEFITKNASAVSQIESALRSLTYIIPGASFEQSCYTQTAY